MIASLTSLVGNDDECLIPIIAWEHFVPQHTQNIQQDATRLLHRRRFPCLLPLGVKSKGTSVSLSELFFRLLPSSGITVSDEACGMLYPLVHQGTPYHGWFPPTTFAFRLTRHKTHRLPGEYCLASWMSFLVFAEQFGADIVPPGFSIGIPCTSDKFLLLQRRRNGVNLVCSPSSEQNERTLLLLQRTSPLLL